MKKLRSRDLAIIGAALLLLVCVGGPCLVLRVLSAPFDSINVGDSSAIVRTKMGNPSTVNSFPDGSHANPDGTNMDYYYSRGPFMYLIIFRDDKVVVKTVL